MEIQQAKIYLGNKPAAQLSYPFGDKVMVYKVMGKMFALLGDKLPQGSKQQPGVNLKCDPDHAIELRDVFDAVIPAYHMNKKHWITVLLLDSIPCGEVERLIDHSYTLVVKKLKKADRLRLELIYSKDELYRD